MGNLYYLQLSEESVDRGTNMFIDIDIYLYLRKKHSSFNRRSHLQ